MKKLAFRFFLSLSILLLSGYGGLQANQFANGHNAVENPEGLVFAHFPIPAGNLDLFPHSVTYGTENPNHRFHVSPFENEEDDDDELNSIRKRLESSSYGTFIFFALSSSCFSSEPKIIPADQYIASAGSDRCVFLRVFRI